MGQSGEFDEQSMEEILASIRSTVDDTEAPPRVPPPSSVDNVGAAVPPAAPRAATHNGVGRLQDALSQIATASATNPATSPITPTASVPPQGATPPVAASKATPPAASPDEDLSDLFEGPPGVQKSPPPAANEKSKPDGSAAPFGARMAGAPAIAEGSGAKKTAEIKAEGDGAGGDGPKKPTTTAAKRVPNFDALNALATGAPLTNSNSETTAVPDDDKKTTSSVLLPEMRNMAGNNPVVEMHSIAAAMAKSQATPEATPETHDAAENGAMASASAGDDEPTEIVMTSQPTSTTAGAPAAGGQSQAELSDGNGALGHGQSANGSRSLEDIVVDILKPQLQNWLEANMPRIVERALRAEQDGPSDT